MITRPLRVGLYARVSTHDQQTLPLQIEAMQDYLTRRSAIVLSLRTKIRRQIMGLMPSNTTDWNEELVNKFNWLKSNRSNEIKQQPQQSQKRARGLSL